ncbi:phage baseplate protein [Serratia rhizosphaerae]|uniref:Baseplate structural protein Gp10 C-terminal domain-containing protein n=1 Tax=Serratia rhizosphaerae TaxID=2597702 RepID=A0ABX6GTI0_9GAMM|nr:hypothetical protein [Serratia rhizosphaerae]QHA89563.1 hypothetical protein FO014_22670 [Serratia rhizosphaerae]
MPIEQAVYISELVEDWPLGTDPQSAGDDHFRLVKKVTKNTFPNATGAITGTPENLNNLTDGITWRKSDTAVAPSYYSVDNPEVMREEIVQERASIAARTPSLDDVKNIPELLLTWQALQNLFYPVGSQYVNYTDSRSPSEILGFGVWEAVVGTLYGAGDVTDAEGITQNIGIGAQAGNFHVKNEHITPVGYHWEWETGLGGWHDHQGGTGAPGARYGSAIMGSDNDHDYGVSYTSHAEEHTHHNALDVTIGLGTANFMTPGYSAYVWRRTE